MNIQDLPSYDKDGEYVKADVRSRWDFLSLQLTRLSTHAARTQGYRVVVRQGRLKSVMTKLVADQLDLVKAYKKKPFYEVKYKDNKEMCFLDHMTKIEIDSVSKTKLMRKLTQGNTDNRRWCKIA